MATRFLLVTGTDTGVGKTVSTAALAVHMRQAGQRVLVVKPVQSGIEPGEEGDIDLIVRLSGIDRTDGVEGIRLPEPLAPVQAAQRAKMTIPPLTDQAVAILKAADAYDVVLIEGAGGVSVELDHTGGTLIDLATALQAHSVDPQFVVIARPGLGTLNHAQLTTWFIQSHELTVAGILVGSAPAADDLPGQLNLEVFSQGTIAPFIGVLPTALGGLDHEAFVETLTQHWASQPLSL